MRVLSIAVLAFLAPLTVSASVAGASASFERGPPSSPADDGPVATGGRRTTEVELPQVSDIAAARDGTPYAGLWIYDSAPRPPASRMRSAGLATARDVSAIVAQAGNTHIFTYRPATSHGGGLLASMRDPRGGLYTSSYSPLGRLLTDENPAGGGWTLARSDNSIDYVRGWTVTMISAEGRTRSYALDYPDRRTQLATTTGPDGLPSTRRISDEGTITFDEPDGTHSTAVHAPDLRFGRAAQYLQSSTVTLPSGLTSTVTASELPTLSDPNDPLSLTGFIASTTTPAGTTTATYEPALRRWTTSSAEGRQSILTLDARGRPFFARTANLAPTTIQYDAAGRLHEVDTDGALSARYAYDGNSNRSGALRSGVPTLGMVNAQDRLTEWGSLVFTYTPNGELASRLDTATSALTQYGYDSSGALRTVALPSGDQIEYLLDPAGRRIGKKVNGVLEQAWLYQDGLRPIAELDRMGNVVSTFVYATGVNVPDYMVRAGVTYRILRDQLASVRLVVDVATGTVAQRVEHDEWVRVVVDTAPGFQPFGYAGGVWDADTRLVHFGAREYDAETGRWTSKDPIGFGGGDVNLYGYVLSDPLNGIDPEGLASCFGVNAALCAGIASFAGVAARGLGYVAQRLAPSAPRVSGQLQRGAQALQSCAARLQVAPQGLTTQAFSTLSSTVRAQAGHLGTNIAVHGSRAARTARSTSDIDIAIRVSAQRFGELIQQRFGTPTNPGSAFERTMLRALETGKIQAGEAGLRALRKALEMQLGDAPPPVELRVAAAMKHGVYATLFSVVTVGVFDRITSMRAPIC